MRRMKSFGQLIGEVSYSGTREILTYDNLSVEIARSEEEIDKAYGLVYNTFKKSGFVNGSEEEFKEYKFGRANSYDIYLGYENNELILTATAFKDGYYGLPADDVFPDEMQKVRNKNRCLVEFGSLASTNTDNNTFTNFISLLLQFSKKLGYDDIVCLVHPKHMKIYDCCFGFEAISDPIPYQAVNHNLAVLAYFKVS